MKVEIGKYRPINKGALKASFTLLIHPEGLLLSDCKYFSVGDKEWINFPSKEIKKEGAKSDFIPLVTYLNKDYLNVLREQALTELKKEELKHAQNDQGFENTTSKVQNYSSFSDPVPF